MTTAKIFIGSGKSGRGQQTGCRGDQCYAVVLGGHADLWVSGPHDDDATARVEAIRWAADNGVEIAGNFRPRAITGADADIRANSPRY